MFGLFRRVPTKAVNFEPERFRIEPPSGSSSIPRPARIIPGLKKTTAATSSRVRAIKNVVYATTIIFIAITIVLAPRLHLYPSTSHLLVTSMSTLLTEAIPSRPSPPSPPAVTLGVGSIVNLASISTGGTFIHDMTYSPRPGWLSGLTGPPQTLPALFFSCGFCATPECSMSDRATTDCCWSFAGFPGELAIALASPAYLTHVAIEHVPTESRLSSAPRDVVVWGLIEGDDNQRKILQSNDLVPKLLSYIPHRVGHTIPYPSASSNAYHFLPIATFQYSIRSPDLYETFDVFQEVQDLEIDFGIIVLQIMNNWGYFETHLHHIGILGRTLIST